MALNGFLEFFQKGKVGAGLHLGASYNVHDFISYYFPHLFLLFFPDELVELLLNAHSYIADISTEEALHTRHNSIFIAQTGAGQLAIWHQFAASCQTARR